jgi:heterodisulfide reductase subunit B
MKVMYYPGCTLKTRAKNLDRSARKSLAALGVELVEPRRWTCCGVVPSWAEDDVMRLLGPVRNLIRMKSEGAPKVVVACSMCYNSLARANLLMKSDRDKKHAINRFLEEEPDYNGEVEVVHLLRFIHDEIGWEKVRERVREPLENLPTAAYYGCTLLRPNEVAIEPPAHPELLRGLLECLGARAVDFPAFATCCSSFQSVTHPDAAAQVASRVTETARRSGAETLVTSCPLCEYNLKQKEPGPGETPVRGDENIRITYFTELMAAGFGIDPA